jgi:hypothetical protein
MASRKPPERSDPSCGSFALLRRRFETVPFVHRARVKARRALRACTRWSLDRNPDSGEKRWVKIATFNVNGINRLPVLLR